MEAVLDLLNANDCRRLYVYSDPSARLHAFLVIDSLALGPAAGGTRTLAYPTALDAIRDACALSAAMTLKCSIAGLDAGGGKMVVMDHPGLDRAGAFRTLGRRVRELGGQFLTAGDLGTTATDLQHMAAETNWVRTDIGDLTGAVARGLRTCMVACADARGYETLRGLHVAIQGCGAIGAAAAAVLAEAGMELSVADLDPAAAALVARRTGARVVPPTEILATECDILAPCAAGGVLDTDTAGAVRAWAVCVAANNVLADGDAAVRLQRREILFVPDIIASAGAVILGVSSYQQRDNAEDLIAALGPTTSAVLEQAAAENRPTSDVALERARARLAAARD